MKVLKIKMDGATKAMRDAGAKKILYDDEGEDFHLCFMLNILFVWCGVVVCASVCFACGLFCVCGVWVAAYFIDNINIGYVSVVDMLV